MSTGKMLRGIRLTTRLNLKRKTSWGSGARKTLLFTVKTLTYYGPFQSLVGAAAFPHGSNFQSLWVCLKEDRDAIASMLRVYGPPATEIFTLNSTLTSPSRKNIPSLPYVIAISTSWTDENMDEESESNGRGSVGPRKWRYAHRDERQRS
jgi:hypothetical protein